MVRSLLGPGALYHLYACVLLGNVQPSNQGIKLSNGADVRHIIRLLYIAAYITAISGENLI